MGDVQLQQLASCVANGGLIAHGLAGQTPVEVLHQEGTLGRIDKAAVVGARDLLEGQAGQCQTRIIHDGEDALTVKGEHRIGIMRKQRTVALLTGDQTGLVLITLQCQGRQLRAAEHDLRINARQIAFATV